MRGPSTALLAVLLLAGCWELRLARDDVEATLQVLVEDHGEQQLSPGRGAPRQLVSRRPGAAGY